YYEYLRTAPDLPTTSQPSVGDFLKVYEPLVADGRDIVSIHIAGGMSGTYESARQAKARLEEDLGEERVTVIDSATVCGGLGLMSFAASAVARAGGIRYAVDVRSRDERVCLTIWLVLGPLVFLPICTRVR